MLVSEMNSVKTAYPWQINLEISQESWGNRKWGSEQKQRQKSFRNEGKKIYTGVKSKVFFQKKKNEEEEGICQWGAFPVTGQEGSRVEHESIWIIFR